MPAEHDGLRFLKLRVSSLGSASMWGNLVDGVCENLLILTVNNVNDVDCQQSSHLEIFNTGFKSRMKINAELMSAEWRRQTARQGKEKSDGLIRSEHLHVNDTRDRTHFRRDPEEPLDFLIYDKSLEPCVCV